MIIARQVSDLTTLITELGTGPCVLAGHSWGGVLVQLLAYHRPDLVSGLVLVDPAHEQMASALPRVARKAIQLARAGRPDELRGGDAAASAAILRQMRSSPAPFPDVPLVVLSATRGFPRRYRAQWTRLQAELVTNAPAGRHVIIGDAGHNIPTDRPDAVADAILQVVHQVR